MERKFEGESEGAFANFGPDRRGFREAYRVGLLQATKNPECARESRPL